MRRVFILPNSARCHACPPPETLPVAILLPLSYFSGAKRFLRLFSPRKKQRSAFPRGPASRAKKQESVEVGNPSPEKKRFLTAEGSSPFVRTLWARS